jgi:undecaprenyl-diphosphatase
METVVQAIVLGVVQGLTEFLPISSSAHLVLVPWLLGWPSPSLAFDVSLHLGTLVAVLFYYRRDWVRLAGGVLTVLRDRRLTGDPDRTIAWWVIIGTVPAALIGYLARHVVEGLTDRPAVVAALLLGTGVILLASAWARGQRRAAQMTVIDAVAIGLAQAVSVLPGISRSGSTIGMGLARGLAPVEAARFSFLLSAPVILGAAIVEVPDVVRGESSAGLAAVATGLLAAALFGFLAIHVLLKLLLRGSLKPFAVYCFAAGGLCLLVATLGLR